MIPSAQARTPLERYEAYLAAQHALAALHGVEQRWPRELAASARKAATSTVAATAEAIAADHGSAGQRRCLRAALVAAIALAAAVDVARALDIADPQLEHAQRVGGRVIAMLGMFFSASSSAIE